MGSCHSCRRINSRRRSRRMNPGNRQLKPSMVIMSLQPVVRLDTSSLMVNPNFQSQVVWALMNVLCGLLNSQLLSGCIRTSRQSRMQPPCSTTKSQMVRRYSWWITRLIASLSRICCTISNLVNCTFKANVSAVPIQFLHSFSLKESNVKAQDYYGNEVSTDHWVGPLNFQYWTVGHNDTRYKNW